MKKQKRQGPPRNTEADIERQLLEAVENWFEDERRTVRSPIGLPNAALRLAELFRTHFPLRPEDYTSRGGAQVRGLSGRSGDKIIERFMPGMRPLGTESGRTSRGLLAAVTRLADALNTLEPKLSSQQLDRDRLADSIQRWVVEHPIKEYFAADRLQPELDGRSTSAASVRALLDAASVRGQVGQVAQHIVGAKLALRFPKRNIENYSYSTADVPTGRAGDFLVSSTVFHVTMTISRPLVTKCRKNLRDGYRVVVLVPEQNRVGAAQLVTSEDLAERVMVIGIESFVGQNVEEIAEFDQESYEGELQRLLGVYNARVLDAEPDPSLQVEIPAHWRSGRSRKRVTPASPMAAPKSAKRKKGGRDGA